MILIPLPLTVVPVTRLAEMLLTDKLGVVLDVYWMLIPFPTAPLLFEVKTRLLSGAEKAVANEAGVFELPPVKLDLDNPETALTEPIVETETKAFAELLPAINAATSASFVVTVPLLFVPKFTTMAFPLTVTLATALATPGFTYWIVMLLPAVPVLFAEYAKLFSVAKL